jgi:glycosyltransferase involved in cell wall biosynthesis
MGSTERVGVVAIGRNEGERLRPCLASALGRAAAVVYVDSGSSDGSAALARSLGAEVVELDAARPYTAARARNEGCRHLLQVAPGLAYVQFVDGDCELVPGWLETAAAWLEQHGDVAAVCGRRRERHPEKSLYNLACDIEWDTPVGEARACGGDALLRVAAFEAAGGYRADLIAGEEPELCVRLRARGWRIHRLAAEMTLHDAGMTRFGQWWRRCLRTGWAYAEGVAMHGGPPERHWVREWRSAWFWGLGLPLAVVGFGVLYGPPGWLAAAVYPLQVVRLALRGRRGWRENWGYAGLLVLGKFPEMLGQVRFLWAAGWGIRARAIEYKEGK